MLQKLCKNSLGSYNIWRFQALLDLKWICRVLQLLLISFLLYNFLKLLLLNYFAYDPRLRGNTDEYPLKNETFWLSKAYFLLLLLTTTRNFCYRTHTHIYPIHIQVSAISVELQHLKLLYRNKTMAITTEVVAESTIEEIQVKKNELRNSRK